MSEKKRWKVLESKELLKSGFFRLRVDRCEMPSGKVVPNYYTFEFSSWVQVVALTKDKKMVLVKQYRHSSGEYSLEVPGGTTSHKVLEDPMVAAARELAEETGYTSNQFICVGKHRPNPAMQNNFIYTYLALDCEKTGEQNLDPFEDIEVMTASIPEVIAMVAKSEIDHSLIIAALFLAMPYMGFELTNK